VAPGLVSVVVPVRNAERWLGAQLEAVASQRYAGDWELVLVDNGSTDGGTRLAREFEDRLPGFRIVDASGRRGVGHARNVGASAARGELLLSCDADDVVGSGWIAAMVDAAAGADIVGGRLEWELLNDEATLAAHAPMGAPAPEMKALSRPHGFLPYAPGCNLAIWTRVARAVRWDESFRYGSSDEDFGWRAQLAGHTLVYAPEAVVHQRLRPSTGPMVRQQIRFGASAPRVVSKFREHGPRPENRRAVRRWRWLARHVHHLWRSPILRRRWLRHAALRSGRLAGSVRHRTLCL
jgi:glycosyltransferase involved in cell wall biosynthesis